jgi:hypothetical protein
LFKKKFEIGWTNVPTFGEPPLRSFRAFSANQLVILAFSVGEIVVGQLSVLLLELALDFIPGALELEFVHINYSGLGGTVGCIGSAASEAFIEIGEQRVAPPEKEL